MKKNHVLLLFSAVGIVAVSLFLGFKSLNSSLEVNAECVEEKVVVTGWVEENGQWYYIDEETLEKEEGFKTVDGERYYFDPHTKAMHVGLLQITDDRWYYMNEEGKMQKDCIIDRFVLNENGLVVRILLTDEELEMRKQELQPVIDEIMKKRGAVSGAVALIESGEVTNTWEYGYAVRNEVPMTEDTKMRVASISKVVAAMNAMKLAEDGILNLDESIGTYWGFPFYNPMFPDNPVTMRSILTHTSSIADLSGYSDIGSKLIKNNVFRKVQPSNPASYSYCNFAFSVAGTTMEKAANKTIYDISKEYFFDPMGLDASFAGGRIQNSDLLATLYYADRSVARTGETMSKMMGSNVPGYDGSFIPGGLCISAKDLAKVISILVNDGLYDGQRYLSEESVAAMETPYGPATLHGADVTQCLALKYKEDIYGEESLYFHTGSAYGAYTLFSYNPKTKNGVVVLTIGASGACDEYGIYSVCGETSQLLYNLANNFMKNYDAETDTWDDGFIVEDVEESSISDDSVSANTVSDNSVSTNNIP